MKTAAERSSAADAAPAPTLYRSRREAEREQSQAHEALRGLTIALAGATYCERDDGTVVITLRPDAVVPRVDMRKVGRIMRAARAYLSRRRANPRPAAHRAPQRRPSRASSTRRRAGASRRRATTARDDGGDPPPGDPPPALRGEVARVEPSARARARYVRDWQRATGAFDAPPYLTAKHQAARMVLRERGVLA